jgi:predicted enzyme related to lactoylglutathione lyase
MARIVHIALKVEDLEKSTKFYEDVFGIYQLKTGHARGHTSRHMTEGTIDLALMTYDSEDEPEAKLAGPGPCIHHFGIEVEDRDAMSGAIEQGGGSIFSDKEEGALKFRAPDGCMAELVNVGRYKLRERSPKARIVHLALKVNDIEKAAAFYQTVFGFKVRGTTQHGDHVSRHLTDGNLDIALMKWDRDDREGAMLAGAGPCIHHWGLEVADREAFAEVVKKHGGEILSKPGAPTLRFRAPDRTIVECVEPGRYQTVGTAPAAAHA